ncbi:MAG: MBL fold metallo-hydrolase [Syntrophomonas sp.]|nr:MBL fold metallo-hydrolase [Syntrophomonas sp.]
MLIELTNQIKVVRPEVQSVFPYSNSLYIDDEVSAMIDAGAGGNAYAKLPVQDIDLLFISHHHFDHINGISFFNNARKIAGREEAWAFQDEDLYIKSTGYQRWEDLMGKPKRKDEDEFTELPADVPANYGYIPMQLAGEFKDGDIFNMGQTSLTAVHTPGHSPGHYSFFFPRESILFSADIDASPRGPWYGEEFCDLDAFIDSIHKLIALKPQILVSSHTRVFDSGVEDLLLAYLDIALQREEKILRFLREPHDVNDIADQNFIDEWKQDKPHILFWHKMMILKHLQRLEKHGQVIKINNDRYIKI